MNTPAYHWVQVSRPFEIVYQQLLNLDRRWLEDAVRTAAEQHERTLEGRSRVGLHLEVRVHLEPPYRAPGIFTLPMAWEVGGSVLPPVLRGELQARQEGQAETRVGLGMLLQQESLPDEEEGLAQARRAVDATTQCFLHRVFWTLEVLSRDDLSSTPGATTGNGNGKSDRLGRKNS